MAIISVAGPRYPLPRALAVAPNQRLSTASCLLVVRMRPRRTAVLFFTFEIEIEKGGIWAALLLGGRVGLHEGLAGSRGPTDAYFGFGSCVLSVFLVFTD